MAALVKLGKFSWYEGLFGVKESNSYSLAQANFILNQTAGTLLSKANGQLFQIGAFNTPSLKNLRGAGSSLLKSRADIGRNFAFDHVIQGDILLEHAKYPGAVFQAASQFNCLEFSSWKSLPESGVGIYAFDPTQGPACALACAAGTVYRNYFVDVRNVPGDVNLLQPSTAIAAELQPEAALDYYALGQKEHRQINNLDDLERLLKNDEHKYFNILNGYTFSSDSGRLDRLNEVIDEHKRRAQHTTKHTTVHSTQPADLLTYDDLLCAIKIGVHAEVGVSFRDRYEIIDPSEGITVTQTYCSALSCAYSGIHNHHWEGLARLVLEANYEATLWAAVINALKATSASTQPVTPLSHRHDVFLTLLGGGVFQNDPQWICDAIGRALAVMKKHNAPINVHISHYRSLNTDNVDMIQDAYDRFLLEV